MVAQFRLQKLLNLNRKLFKQQAIITLLKWWLQRKRLMTTALPKSFLMSQIRM